MGGHSETSWEQTLGPLAGFWGKGKFCLSQSLEPLLRETFGIEDKVRKLVLQVQQICLRWTQPCLLQWTMSLYLGATLPMEQRSHLPLARGPVAGTMTSFLERVLCHVLAGESGDIDSSPSSAINQLGDPEQAVLPIQARLLLKIGLPALSMPQSLISEVWVGQARKRHSFHSSFP